MNDCMKQAIEKKEKDYLAKAKESGWQIQSFTPLHSKGYLMGSWILEHMRECEKCKVNS